MFAFRFYMSFIKEHKNGIIGTLLFHGAVLVLLIFLGFTTEYPLPAEEGIMINFGNTDEGSGPIEPENNAETDNQELVSNSNPSEASSSEDAQLTQDFEDAPEVIKTPEKKPEKTAEEIERERIEKERQELEREMSDADFNNSNNNNNSSSEGDGNKTGNQGDPNGNPNTHGNGQGSKGISYSLGGRKASSLPKPINSTNEGGVVVVEITVDPNGNVLTATPGMAGSSTNNKALLQAAKKAALKTKFTKKSNAPAKQIGVITYRFVLR